MLSNSNNKKTVCSGNFKNIHKLLKMSKWKIIAFIVE